MKQKSTNYLTLNGTINDGRRHRYNLEKNEAFKKGFSKFMEGLGFDSGKINNCFFSTIDGGDGEEIRVPVRVSEIRDVVWFFQNEEYELDVFFGNKKIIIVLRTKNDFNRNKRLRMLDVLESESGWISEQEKEKRVKKCGKNKLSKSKR